MANGAGGQIDRFFAGPGSRGDQWRNLVEIAESGARAKFDAALAELAVTDAFHAYPGPQLLAALRNNDSDMPATAALARRILRTLLTGAYRRNPGEWSEEDDENTVAADVLPPTLGHGDARRPYFEVLIVTGAPVARWAAVATEWRHLRRPQDPFVYEPVFVGSFEDAFCATVLNANLAAVIIQDGFPFASRNDAPILRSLLTGAEQKDSADASALRLAQVIKRTRPELDIYLVSTGKIEEIAGSPQSRAVRRLFYAVEELLELHLAVLEGVQARCETPFFDNLKKYAQRPVGTFHALPIARGKSIFKSDWIRDMGEFYGPTLFLAESSATTGGLDSLLEPTGNIKKQQEATARAFGAKRAYLGTNGTSTSNKIVVQAVCKPGDIVIVDRNCHKSHHYGFVLTGAQPYYVEAYPLTQYSMYGAVPLRTIKKALLDCMAEGKLDRVKVIDMTNCTFDGHMYNPRRVMEECLAIKPDLIFLWDEAWFGFARFNPYHRRRTGMGAAAALSARYKDPAYRAEYKAWAAKVGTLDPKNPKSLDMPLLPDPDRVRIRVYQTHSTHKSMSAFRQGSMILVWDEDFHHVEGPFEEAFFTHTSTSPNLQLLASLDLARRQMELEGYALTMQMTELAIRLRRAINAHPLISKYFHVATPEEMVPAEFRASGIKDYGPPHSSWAGMLVAWDQDEFALDPTRLTLVCGAAGFDGTQFKGLLAERFDIQLNKTSRNSVLIQTNINNTQSDAALLIKTLADLSREIDQRLAQEGKLGQEVFAARVKSLMTDVPDLPNFSRFHDAFRDNPKSVSNEGHMRPAFFMAYEESNCEFVKLGSKEVDERVKNGPELVSANFVIPYPPGFPIMVPGQVITADTIAFMRKLDVKEIHGYHAAHGIKVLKPAVLAARSGAGKDR